MGGGLFSPVITFYSSDLPKSIPGGLTYTSLTKTGALINWSMISSSEDQGYSTTSLIYILEMDDCRNGPFSNILLETTILTTYTISSITPGSVCRFRMNARNVIGFGPYSDILTIQFAQEPG